ncbi:unnamed protein product [Linum tenue]|uniref:Uncharacterized protein n=1 Tax=Linum tenue TaxID=586396 RepID=A0AAV0IY88_9ROSI|nr:unnamed protein product [Linum tenue]
MAPGDRFSPIDAHYLWLASETGDYSPPFSECPFAGVHRGKYTQTCSAQTEAKFPTRSRVLQTPPAQENPGVML